MTFSQSQFQTLFAYHWHTSRRLMDAAARLDEAAYKEHPGYGHGSIHDLLFHILRTDYGWRLGLEHGRQLTSLRPEEFPDLKSLQTGFEAEAAAWQMFLNSLSAAEIEGT
ncbi:MAG: hypothetical protein EXR62_08845 [Chloroflexi bacterium]|nr:hypothetical protein [Chloroflexota bacterium]